MNDSERINDFLAGETYAVVGASSDRSKYGNKVLRAYLQDDRVAWPVHPRATEIEGCVAYPSLAELPDKPHGVSIITPPQVSAEITRQAIELGLERLWFQPGSEAPEAIAEAREAGLEVIADGPCVLVALHYRED